ncbi:MAG: NTP transferase domain-containing protein [Gammaproteobacteria bacterium]|nr:NTP transferase domain-containing protein [Gammaproteobacteria bacterium]
MPICALALADATGHLLVHSYRLPDGTVNKGRRLTPSDITRLAGAGVTHVHVLMTSSSDIDENEAAHAIAMALSSNHVVAGTAANGRCDLYADSSGILTCADADVTAINANSAGINLILRPMHTAVTAGEVIGEVKVVPYAIDPASLAETLGQVARPDIVSVAPFVHRRCGVLQTHVGFKRDAIFAKTLRVLHNKLQQWNAEIDAERIVEHESHSVRQAISELCRSGCELILVAGASATTADDDVIPAAILADGGEVVQLGVPVDPGTLLGICYSGTGIPVLILPGSQRSPAPSSFDLLVPRLLTGERLERPALQTLGVGGLLTRGSRASAQEKFAVESDEVTAIVLAGGASRRMGTANKMLAEVSGSPMVARVVSTLRKADVDRIVVVTGHDATAVRCAIDDETINFVHNEHYAEGMSTSLRTGVAAAMAQSAAVLICLGDMPLIAVESIDAILAVPNPKGTIVVPVHAGARGNPVRWGRDFLPALELLRGDRGARALLDAYAEHVIEVALDDEGILRDFDTPEALRSLTSTGESTPPT